MNAKRHNIKSRGKKVLMKKTVQSIEHKKHNFHLHNRNCYVLRMYVCWGESKKNCRSTWKRRRLQQNQLKHSLYSPLFHRASAFFCRLSEKKLCKHRDFIYKKCGRTPTHSHNFKDAPAVGRW